jgi:hypothetical protein
MSDPIAFIGPLAVQLCIDVIRQVAFALPIAFLWEFEKKALWCPDGEAVVVMEVPLLITGLTAGSISVLLWPHENIVSNPVAAFAALASPLLAGGFMRHTGIMFRELGQQPPSMFAVRDAAIFALGISLMRVATLA